MTSIGAVKVGTVGVMHSGRLVLVLDVDDYRATVVSLPDQLHPGPYDDSGKHLTEVEQADEAFVVTPYVSITPVNHHMLGDLNRKFIAERPASVRPAPKKCARCSRKFTSSQEDVTECGQCQRARTSPPRPSPTVSVTSTSPQPPISVVGEPKPPYIVKYHKFEREFGLVLQHVASHGTGGRDAVIKVCLQHERWTNRRSAIRDIPWFLKQLEKAGFVQ